jgi:hypothetical protein
MHSAQNTSSSHLLSKSIKIEKQSIILTIVICGCETWSLTIREVLTSRVFENRVLLELFGSKSEKVTGGRRK